jgi:hypothetical protein
MCYPCAGQFRLFHRHFNTSESQGPTRSADPKSISLMPKILAVTPLYPPSNRSGEMLCTVWSFVLVVGQHNRPS